MLNCVAVSSSAGFFHACTMLVHPYTNNVMPACSYWRTCINQWYSLNCQNPMAIIGLRSTSSRTAWMYWHIIFGQMLANILASLCLYFYWSIESWFSSCENWTCVPPVRIYLQSPNMSQQKDLSLKRPAERVVPPTLRFCPTSPIAVAAAFLDRLSIFHKQRFTIWSRVFNPGLNCPMVWQKLTPRSIIGQNLTRLERGHGVLARRKAKRCRCSLSSIFNVWSTPLASRMIVFDRKEHK